MESKGDLDRARTTVSSDSDKWGPESEDLY